jgi:hypothetical protein
LEKKYGSELPHEKINLFLVSRRCALSLKKAAMIQNYKFSISVHRALPCLKLCTLQPKWAYGMQDAMCFEGSERQKNSCFEQLHLNYLF